MKCVEKGGIIATTFQSLVKEKYSLELWFRVGRKRQAEKYPLNTAGGKRLSLAGCWDQSSLQLTEFLLCYSLEHPRSKKGEAIEHCRLREGAAFSLLLYTTAWSRVPMWQDKVWNMNLCFVLLSLCFGTETPAFFTSREMCFKESRLVLGGLIENWEKGKSPWEQGGQVSKRRDVDPGLEKERVVF